MPDPALILREAYDTVRRDYGRAIGQRRDELITPALVLDIDAAQRNIDHMASELKQMGAATIRPHYKTHKSPDLARRQLQAGAGGLSMATVWEAAILAAAGMDDLFVVNTVAHPAKLRVLAELAREHRVLVAVDEAANAASASAAAVTAGSTLGIMVEVDTGMDRCGTDNAADCLALARQVMDLPGLRFEGITGYEGHCSMTPDHDLRHERQREAMKFFTDVAGQLEANGIPVPDPVGRRDCHLELDRGLPGRDGDPGRHVRGHGQLPRPDGARLRALAHHRGHGHQPAERQGHRGRRQQVGRRPGGRDDGGPRPPGAPVR